MSFKGIVRELREMKDGIGSISKRVGDRKHWHSRMMSHIAPDLAPNPPSDLIQQGQWANLPPELLLDIIQRVEESEATWPARAVVVSCASVCKSWRAIVREIVKTPEQCGRLTFPISLKQPGPRQSPIQCFIRGIEKLPHFICTTVWCRLRVRKINYYDFSRASSTYVGKLRSNFLGTKFTVYDSQPPCDAVPQTNSRSSRRFHSKQVSPRVPACNYSVGTVCYELNILRTRGPRRMHCAMPSIPVSSIQEGGTAPTPTLFSQAYDEHFAPSPCSTEKELVTGYSSTNLSEPHAQGAEPLVLKNKSPRWHEQLQCWCLNFRGRVTVASVKNFQLVAAVVPSHNVSAEEQERVILQFGKIGKDIFTVDYRYPLSCFQAFAICLSSFDTKPACE
ncbi:tubby-like F-box protein 5 [Prunus yedoensis var. nudiflora]|uniref:Tubby-like F-box protein n=1 Tax=Prunus yedoensis var. nudiflora TaxID=2094558 RepID=A0A314YUI2_PRUYE|nr:tubby-like F-box protein 5 [Prunus yedoensis var. nudiflora]